jgi:hypothetical protein
MFEKWNKKDMPKCPDCGVDFDNAFEAVDHFLEEEEEFDPALILPGGYRLLIGSLLRGMFKNRNNPDFIKEVTESTYVTLFTAEFNPDFIGEAVEDIIVETEMENFDVQLKNLFKNGE